MTSIEVPYSIAAALPTLSVMDITNEVARTVAALGAPRRHRVHLRDDRAQSLVRVQERETGFFEDLEALLERVVPATSPSRERLVAALLGTRTEQIPFSDGALCLGQWQRVMLLADSRSTSELTSELTRSVGRYQGVSLA